MMRPLNKREWKKFQKLVKKTDEESTKASLGVSFYVADLILDKDGNITNVKGELF